MPDYKKKKHSKSDLKRINQIVFDDEVTPKRTKTKSASTDSESTAFVQPRVIKGRLQIKNKKAKITVCLVAVLFCLLLISYFLFPVGLFETLSNTFSSFGSGEYPISTQSSNVKDIALNGNYYFLLTDINLLSVSNSGKEISSFGHGFSDPVLCSSKTRALVYGQGQNNLGIYTVGKNIISKTFKNDILCAAISDSGVYAVATLSDSYSSSVTVYDKKGKSLFSWNCAKGTANSLALSPDGKKFAVSTIAASDGELISKLYLFNINDTDPQNTYEYGNNTIYSLNSNHKGFFVVSKLKYGFVFWSKGKKTDNDVNTEINIFRTTSSGALLVLNRRSDRSDNKIIVLKNNGEQNFTFDYKGNIKDIRQKGSRFFISGDSEIKIVNKSGNLLKSVKCEHDIRYLVPDGYSKCVAVSDNIIQLIYIK